MRFFLGDASARAARAAGLIFSKAPSSDLGWAASAVCEIMVMSETGAGAVVRAWLIAALRHSRLRTRWGATSLFVAPELTPVRAPRPQYKEARSMKSANTARDDRINTRIFLPNIPETSLLHDGASVLIKIKSSALASRYAGKRGIKFF
jgi:hypothetical protein